MKRGRNTACRRVSGDLVVQNRVGTVQNRVGIVHNSKPRRTAIRRTAESARTRPQSPARRPVLVRVPDRRVGERAAGLLE